MAPPSHAQELSPTIQTIIEATSQEINQNTRMEAPVPSSVASAFNGGESEEHSGNQIKNEKSQRAPHYQPENSTEINETDRRIMSQAGVGHPWAQKSNNGGPDSDPPIPISHDYFSKATRDQLSSLEILSELSRHQLAELRQMVALIEVSTTSKVEFIWGSVLQLVGLIFVVVFGVFAALAYIAADVANTQASEANQLSLLTFCMLNPNTTGDTCAAVSQHAVDSLRALAVIVLGPTAIITATSTPSPAPSSTSKSSISINFTSPITTSASSSAILTSTTSTILRPSASSSTSLSNELSRTPGLSSTNSILASPSITLGAAPTPSSGNSTTHSSNHLSTPGLVGTVVGAILGLTSILVSYYTFFAKFRRMKYHERRPRSPTPEAGQPEGESETWRTTGFRTPLNV